MKSIAGVTLLCFGLYVTQATFGSKVVGQPVPDSVAATLLGGCQGILTSDCTANSICPDDQIITGGSETSADEKPDGSTSATCGYSSDGINCSFSCYGDSKRCS